MAAGDKLLEMRAPIAQGIPGDEVARDRAWIDLQERLRTTAGELAAVESELLSLREFRKTITPLLVSSWWKGATDGAGGITTLSSYNIASVTIGAVVATVTFDIPLINNGYSVWITSMQNVEVAWATVNDTASGFLIRARDTAGLSVIWSNTAFEFTFGTVGGRAFT